MSPRPGSIEVITLRIWKWVAAVAVASACTTTGVARADTITVNTTTDPAGACSQAVCSLRQAVAAAHDGDTIKLPAGEPYVLTQGAPVEIGRRLAITGADARTTVVDASGNRDADDQTHRIFNVDEGAQLDLRRVTLTGGDQVDADETCPFGLCWKLDATGGGALLNAAGATTSLSQVALVGNRARVGGALASAGTLDLTDVDFSRDEAPFGGGLFLRGGSASARRVAFHDVGNEASGGGALFLFGGALTLRDSTLAGNGGASATAGGIENYGGALTMASDTLAHNQGGSLMTDQGHDATTTVLNTIIASSAGAPGCVPVGTQANSDTSSDRAVTIDSGHNLDADGQCLLTGDGDVSDVDAKLAPMGDNGGGTPTLALLHESPALDGADGEQCSLTDQRGVARPQGAGCDIGAFEAVRAGAPKVTTDPASDVATTTATLHASARLAGEAGSVRFLLGTAPDELHPAGIVAAAGDPSQVRLALEDLQPHTTYLFRAIADNASSASAPGDTLAFTTASGPPAISDVTVDAVDDNTAAVHFEIDTGGAATQYALEYGGDDTYGQTTAPVAVGAAPGPQQVTYVFTSLDPDTTYHFDIVATSPAAPDGVRSADAQFHTDAQLSGTRGQAVTFDDSGEATSCPQAVRIDWGDGQVAEQIPVPPCTSAGEHQVQYSVTATHAYAATGHYMIRADYGNGTVTREWALISPPPQRTLTVEFASNNSGTGTVRSDPAGVNCPSACQASFDIGTTVVLTATPATGSRFASWDGACTGTGRCSVTLSDTRDVTARFALLPPVISSVRVAATTETTATVSLAVDPGGADAHYVVAFGPTTAYGQTDAFDVPGKTGARQVTRTLSGLSSGSTFHFRVTATSAVAPGGVTSADGVFTTAVHAVAATPTPVATAIPTPVATPVPTPTATPAPPLAPRFGQTAVVRPLSGAVLAQTSGTRLTRLTGSSSVPVGARIDATRGRASVDVINRAGGSLQTATVSGGMFKLTQSGALTSLTLSGPAPSCSPKAKKAARRRTLSVAAKGGFAVVGSYSSAVGDGAAWQVTDTCTATTTRVGRGRVVVDDSVRHKRATVTAGHQYVARRRR